MNISMGFVADCVSNLLNRLLTMFKLIIRNKILGTEALSDDVWKVEKLFNLIRIPFIDSSMQNVIVGHYNKITHKTGFLNSVVLILSLLVVIVVSLIYLKFNLILGYLKISHNITSIFNGYAWTLPILILYTVFFSIGSLSKSNRPYTSSALFVGNIAFTLFIFVAAIKAIQVFIGYSTTWIIGNILYSLLPTIICGYFFIKSYKFEWALSMLPLSFFMGLFNIYWKKIIQFILNQYIINKMQIGNFSELNFGYKISDIITQAITKPIMRDVISNSQSNTSISDNISLTHIIIVFPILYFSINISYILKYFMSFKNNIVVMWSCVGYFALTYFQSIITIIKTHLILNNDNLFDFISSNINIILQAIFMILLLFICEPYQVMILGQVLASIFEFIYLYFVSKIQISSSLLKIIISTLISILLSIFAYIICMKLQINSLYITLLNIGFGIVSYILYLYCYL